MGYTFLLTCDQCAEPIELLILRFVWFVVRWLALLELSSPRRFQHYV